MTYSHLGRAALLGRLFSNASLYGLGTLLTRAGGLLLLPLYWIKLSPADYGVIGLCQAVMIFLAPVLGLGLNDAMQRFYYEWPEARRHHQLATLWVCACAFGLLICGALDFLGPWLLPRVLTQVSFDPLLRIAIWSAFAVNVSLMPLTVMRVREEALKFTVVTVLSFVLQSALAMYFLFALQMGVMGYLLAILINSAVWSIYAVYLMCRGVRFSFRWASTGDSLRYALPLVPTSVIEGLSTTLDRLVMDKFVGLTQIGLYSLGNQFGSAVNVFNQVLKSAWIPFVFRIVSERPDGPAILGKFSVYYLAALCVPALAIALLSEEVIILFGGARFRDVYPFVPAFVLLYIVQSTGTALGRGIDIARKTQWSLVVPSVSLATGLVSLSLLVPAFGVWGAVGAALITTAVRTVVHIALALHFYPRPLHCRALAVVVGIAAVAFWAGYSTATGHLLLDVLLELIVVAVAALAIFWFALDRQQGLALLRKLGGRA